MLKYCLWNLKQGIEVYPHSPVSEKNLKDPTSSTPEKLTRTWPNVIYILTQIAKRSKWYRRFRPQMCEKYGKQQSGQRVLQIRKEGAAA